MISQLVLTALYLIAFCVVVRLVRATVGDQFRSWSEERSELLSMIQKKDRQISALTESLTRAEGRPFIRASDDIPPSVHVAAGPRAFATRPFPPMVERAIKGV